MTNSLMRLTGIAIGTRGRGIYIQLPMDNGKYAVGNCRQRSAGPIITGAWCLAVVHSGTPPLSSAPYDPGFLTSLSLMQSAFDMAVEYVHDRKQFGQPVGEFQLMQGTCMRVSKAEEKLTLWTFLQPRSRTCTRS